MNNKRLDGTKLSLCLGLISEEIIYEALNAKAQKKNRINIKYSLVAACLVLLVTTILIEFKKANFPSSEVYNFSITNVEDNGDSATEQYQKKYEIVCFELKNNNITAPLFVNTITPAQNICEAVRRLHPEINCDNAIYIFRTKDDGEQNYWFPLYENGKIVNVVFASALKDGRVIIGHSESEVDSLNTISSLTSKSSPLYLVSDGVQAYYLVGNKAYVNVNTSQKKNGYIGSFIIPDAEIDVVKIF